MRAIILHWTSGFEFPLERYIESFHAKEVAFGIAAVLWVALVFVIVHFERGMFPG